MTNATPERMASFLVECKAAGVADDSPAAAEYWRVAATRRGVAEARTMRAAEVAMGDMFLVLVWLLLFGRVGSFEVLTLKCLACSGLFLFYCWCC